jgi:hypothetical protein
MMTTTLRIDNQFFYVDADQDTDRLRADVLAGSREPAYVHFSAQGRGTMSVLMSPGMSAQFEVRDSADDASVVSPSPLPLGCYDFFPGDLD